MENKSGVIVTLLFCLNLLVGESVQYNIDSSGGASPNSTLIVRRRVPAVRSLSLSGSNRLALMNSRFNRRPRKKNLDPEQLLEILGDFYDPNWMSIDEPTKSSDNDITYMVREDAWPYQELMKAAQQLNLSKELAAFSNTDIDPGTVSIFERWLLRKGSCPVKYSWEDIGTMFWPRWIRVGECSSVPGTCSWPPGMHCVVTGRSNLHILRWQCRTPKAKRRKSHKRDWSKRMENDPLMLKCQWVRVPYPITSACHCTC